MKIELKGIVGVVAAVIVAAAALGYHFWVRHSLVEDGRTQVKTYLETELVARAMRDSAQGKRLRAADLERLREFEIVDFAPPWFLGEKPRVRVVIRSPSAEETFYFRFRKVLGSWRLQHETHAPLLAQ